MARSAALVESVVAGDRPVYGVTTGFGSLAHTVIPAERTAELQVALVRSHATVPSQRVLEQVRSHIGPQRPSTHCPQAVMAPVAWSHTRPLAHCEFDAQWG